MQKIMNEMKHNILTKAKHIGLILLWLLICLPSTYTHTQELEKGVKFSQHKILPLYNLKKLSNTIIFQGNRKKKNYFEGWYFKMVSNDGTHIMSIIPGISLSKDGKEQHAFVQMIDGVTAQTSYYSFPIEAFSFSAKKFEIRIGNNYFSEDKIILDLRDSISSISGTVEMSEQVSYTSGRWMNFGIMGWYRFVPFMECYHGVVSLTHTLKGALKVNDVVHTFDQGKGYIEKDWGSGMPSSWIWMQSNHFSDTSTSFMLSVASIPWLRKSFNGFLGFLYHNGKTYHFATYRRTKLHLEVTESNVVNIRIEDKKHTIIIQAKSRDAGLLKAPVQGSMDRRIAESINAELKVTLLDKKGKTIFVDSTGIAGLEMVGDFKRLQGLLK
jgi:tocopherol cyclase